MIRPAAEFPSHKSLTMLSRMLLQPRQCDSAASPEWMALKHELPSLGRDEFSELLALAHLHHVDVRWLEVFISLTREEGDATRTEWAETALADEHMRITTAVRFLHDVCAAFQNCNYDVTVIKSLDHWPDLGSDLDLYTDADVEDVAKLLHRRFGASIAPRSWGDRLANKWNFLIPDLPEPVEVHVGRLGQTGEQLIIASSLGNRARQVCFGDYHFQISSISDRLMISTLQRMYRHFNFRLCDIVDTTSLADAGAIDYKQLRSLASKAGIWEGVATYLRIVSDYVMSYRKTGLDLPEFVQGTRQGSAASKFSSAGAFCGYRSCRSPPGSMDRNWRMCWGGVN